MNDTRFHTFFLCTGNSARSIMAETILNSLGSDRFIGYSAGSSPEREVRPEALQLLKRMQLPTESLRNKSWDEFLTADAPSMDFVITVRDRAAAEPCPVWPGRPITAH